MGFLKTEETRPAVGRMRTVRIPSHRPPGEARRRGGQYTLRNFTQGSAYCADLCQRHRSVPFKINEVRHRAAPLRPARGFFHGGKNLKASK
jgi:hypothetical protein